MESCRDGRVDGELSRAGIESLEGSDLVPRGRAAVGADFCSDAVALWRRGRRSEGDVDVVAFLVAEAAVDAFAGADVGVVRFDDEGLEHHDFAFAKAGQWSSVDRFHALSGGDVGVGLEGFEHLRCEHFGGALGAKVVLDAVLCLARR